MTATYTVAMECVNRDTGDKKMVKMAVYDLGYQFDFVPVEYSTLEELSGKFSLAKSSYASIPELGHILRTATLLQVSGWVPISLQTFIGDDNE